MHFDTLLSRTFTAFVRSEKTAGFLLIACTALSLALANSAVGEAYRHLWHAPLGGLSVERWINDGLMAIFFLLIGLELERELYNGELSDLRSALLPGLAAAGGIAAPALIHFALNRGTTTQAGLGIPMATDIAFALGVLALLGQRVPASLKVFLAALAVMDDLGAIVVIAVFYTADVALAYLAAAFLVWAGLLLLNRLARVQALWPYLLGGAVMWLLMFKSGVHATIAGVLLAFAIPYSSRCDDTSSPSHRLEHALHQPVAWLILPLFALANTGIALGGDWLHGLTSPNALGIILGLCIGKPAGIGLACGLAVASGLCPLPAGLAWRHLAGAALLGGIGFTMSIFIANLAFPAAPAVVSGAKLAVLCASLIAGMAGYGWLRLSAGRQR
ncbi:sodium/proton antiporter, NhaA family [Duganella sacchari]|uniref:Na(+)/H(+) antiporter NhaA n=1 Tax=Duganella sacchari TaxID=551987 RepID=A0A1M7NPD2_9BURK|nr:Na+/H+ antiporter NhaA [Duganella sacchari]SHN05609.1 sodium/proton antiporter, NhaA family [Duganella sacchari]